MTTSSTFWQRITATRYTRALEAEVLRLRAENRALLNSILGIAGVPPITLPDSVSVSVGARVARHAASGEASAVSGVLPGLPAASAKTPGGITAAPIRRRSWHQIYRLLELDSAKKKPQEDLHIPPATRARL